MNPKAAVKYLEPLFNSRIVWSLLITAVFPACQDTQATSSLTSEDIIGESFFQYYFSHTETPGTYFLSQLDKPELKPPVIKRLADRFAPSLVLRNKRDADRRYTRYSEGADSSLILVDPRTGHPGFTLAVTSIRWISRDTVDVSFILASIDDVRKSTYTLRREGGEAPWNVIAFGDLSSMP